jgi:hypothetical protein
MFIAVALGLYLVTGIAILITRTPTKPRKGKP